MTNLMSSDALCAHLHDTYSGLLPLLGPVNEGVLRNEVRSLVDTIYESSRPIDLCKEISQYIKFVIAGEAVNKSDLDNFHHLAFSDEMNYHTPGLPRLRHRSLHMINRLCSLDRSPERDKALTVLTKLHALALPLKIADARSKIIDMNNNIMSDFVVTPLILEEFQDFINGYNFGPFYDSFEWYNVNNLYSLHNLACANYGSTKLKPCIDHAGEIQLSSKIDDMRSYDLRFILQSKDIRSLYLKNKEEFMTLIAGIPVDKVIDDSNILKYKTYDVPIGREGIRLQEAEKVRALWMPMVIFTSLCHPITTLLENLVKRSKHQTIFLNDREALTKMHSVLFRNYSKSDEYIYSIDQTAFTDNYSYSFQRIILEKFYHDGKIPLTSLNAFDLQIKGRYRPMESLHIGHDIQFAKGTPMGADGGFMLATFSHELLIKWLSQKLHILNPKFWVQGDDAVIKGDSLFKAYDDTMTNLGCEVNQLKTMKSYKAIEYCGFIATYQGSITPMFRPHDRFLDEPKDILSERATDAFSLPILEDWIYNNRPEIVDQLQISGYLPIDESDPDYKCKLVSIQTYRALVAYRQCMPSPFTKEQRERLFVPQQYYPIMDTYTYKGYSPSTDRNEYLDLCDHLKWHYNKLINDPNADLISESYMIYGISDIILKEYKEHVPPQGFSKKSPEKRERNPYKPDYRTDTDVKNIERSMNLAKRYIEHNSLEKGGEKDNDEPVL